MKQSKIFLPEYQQNEYFVENFLKLSGNKTTFCLSYGYKEIMFKY